MSVKLSLSPPLRAFSLHPQCLFRHFNSSSPRSHDDLASFLHHAAETNLPQDTTVYVGTVYEYTVMQALSHLGMVLSRTGGRGDRGVDLSGTWTPPTAHARTLKVFIQCKAEQRRTGPKFFREMEGTMADADDALGVLSAVSTTTPGTIQHMLLSKKALAYCSVAPLEEGGYLRQLVWNSAAVELLGSRLGVTVRYRKVKGKKDGEEEFQQEAVLTLDGRTIDPPVPSDGSKKIEDANFLGPRRAVEE